ncbi:MAG: hypothetical protein H0T79_19850 [Deltaproteobacteria bacterium]|nr:hypothetical protein [Deltaproteobacteria bacterium]
MRFMVMVLLVAVACGKGGEGWECTIDADCDKGLMCGLLQGPDGTRTTMCVNSDNLVNVSGTPKSYRTYALPIGVGGAFLVVLLMLRASVIARGKRKRPKAPPASR